MNNRHNQRKACLTFTRNAQFYA